MEAYKKMPVWQKAIVYLVIGGVAYFAIYYFFFSKNNSYKQEPAPVSNTTLEDNKMSKNLVTIENFKYSPEPIKIKVGDMVIWTNKDAMSHSATADDKSFDTGVFQNGESKSITFTKAGTFTYHCSVHPSMKGTIVVTN